MRRTAGALAAVLTLLTLTVAGPPATALEPDSFAGSWESYDIGDGSYQTLTVRGTGTEGMHGVRLIDTAASQACAGAPASVQGRGSVSGTTMTFLFTITCPGSGKGPTTGLIGPILFRYHAGSDTLTDGSGTVWHRTS